eukprot:Colp12_sorted_trinity150504_noHs@29873
MGVEQLQTPPLSKQTKQQPAAKTPQAAKVIAKPKPPDRARTAYQHYAQWVWESVRTELPAATNIEVLKEIGSRWKSLEFTEKQKWVNMYNAEKEKYNKEYEKYIQSEEYQEWALQEEQRKLGESSSSTAQPTQPTKQNVESGSQIAQVEWIVEHGEVTSAKALAHARYQRNQDIALCLFERPVPADEHDYGEINWEELVVQQELLKRKKAEVEQSIVEMQEEHQRKRQKIIDSAYAFQELYQKCSNGEVDEKALPVEAELSSGPAVVQVPVTDLLVNEWRANRESSYVFAQL